MTKIVIGAPSLTGKDANADIKAAFEAAEYPLSLVLTSSANFNVSLPEADVLLRPGASVEARFASFAKLQRAASSLAQVAELNRLACIATVAALASEEQEAPAAEAAEQPEPEASEAAAKPATTRKAK